MKKVVRLSENDLNRLVRRIISEAPFDDSRSPKLDMAKFDNMSDEDISDFAQHISGQKQKYSDFEKNGIKMNPNDVEILLAIANDYCNSSKTGGRKHYGCREISRIEQNVNTSHYQNFSKRKKHSPLDGF